MSRPLRIEYPGAFYHITARGNARQRIFLNDADRKLFLGVLAERKDEEEIPKRQRYHGRPSLAELFGEEELAGKKRRNRVICKAHLSHGYTLKEIGEFAGIHYSTVSRIVKSHRM
jgi:AraC-like DNA-binding protein